MSDITRARKALVARILEGDGRASHAQRRSAFNNAGLPEPLNRSIEKVAKRAYTVTDEDIAAVKAAPSHRLLGELAHLDAAPIEKPLRAMVRMLRKLTRPTASGISVPSFGLLLSPVTASATMTFSSASAIANALSSRRVSRQKPRILVKS